MIPYTLRLTSLLLILFSFPAWSGKVIDRTVVTVNDDVILESDIDRFLAKSKSDSFKELFGGIDPEQLKDRKKVLGLLIEEKIINQQVKKLDLEATDQEIDGQIRSIVTRNNITNKQLETRLKQLGTTMSEYREGIRRQIERRNLIEREIKPNLEVSEDKLKQFYKRSRTRSKGSVRFQIAHIYLDPDKSGGVSAKKRADTVWKEVSKDPSAFASLASEYSDDASTSGNGGKLGYFSLSSLVDEFKKVVPSTPVGKVTKPIKTSAGYHIVKVLDRASADYDSLTEEQKANLRNALVSIELERKMASWLERRKREAHIREFRATEKNE